MPTTDENVLTIIDHLKSSGQVKYKTHVYELIETDAIRVFKIKNKEKYKYQSFHFTAENIRLLCHHFKINANYIFGLENNMYLK